MYSPHIVPTQYEPMATANPDTLRWMFTSSTPLGDSRSIFEIRTDALHYESDAVLGGGKQTLRWDTIRQAATASMAGMGGRGAPQMADWVPTEMEWLLVARVAGQGEPFMRPLPPGRDRDAIVAAVRDRLSTRWIGERLPLKQAQAQLGMTAGTWSTLKVVGLVLAVLASLVGLLLLLILLLHPVISIPAGFLIGGWVFRHGLRGLRDYNTIVNTPTAKISSAAMGLVELAGHVFTEQPSVAGITGTASVWWDVSVRLRSNDSDNSGEWRQVAARHGGKIDVVQLEDETGRVPIWLADASLLLTQQSWQTGKDTLPPAGVALLDELGFPWSQNTEIQVTEQRLAVSDTLYVLGTLDERRNADSQTVSLSSRAVRMWRTGEWRGALVNALPAPLKTVVAVLIGYLGLVTGVGRGGERRAQTTLPPAIAPTAALVWKGRSGRPFVVSNQSEQQALAALRKQSLITIAFGGGILCYTLYQLIDLMTGT